MLKVRQGKGALTMKYHLKCHDCYFNKAPFIKVMIVIVSHFVHTNPESATTLRSAHFSSPLASEAVELL
jgi:hypothetical protein